MSKPGPIPYLTETFQFKISGKLKNQLDTLSRKDGVPKAMLAREAIRLYVKDREDELEDF